MEKSGSDIGVDDRLRETLLSSAEFLITEDWATLYLLDRQFLFASFFFVGGVERPESDIGLD